jgi:hypothetical protein
MERYITNAVLIAVNDYYETVRPLARKSCRSYPGSFEHKLYEPRSLFADAGTTYMVYSTAIGENIVYDKKEDLADDICGTGRFKTRAVQPTASDADDYTIIVKMDPFATVTMNGHTITHEMQTIHGLRNDELLMVVLAVTAQTPPRFVYCALEYGPINQFGFTTTTWERSTVPAPLAALDAVATYLQDVDTHGATRFTPSPASIFTAANAFRAVNTYRNTAKKCTIRRVKYLDREYHIVKSDIGEITDKNIGERSLFQVYEAVVALLAQTPISSLYTRADMHASSIVSVDRRPVYHASLDAPIEILTSAVAFIRRELMSRVDRPQMHRIYPTAPEPQITLTEVLAAPDNMYDDIVATNAALKEENAVLKEENEKLRSRFATITSLVNKE